ncbi:MAG: NADPH-dependent glutamate synthase, partial [Thermoanaerobaculia bacterium]
MTRPTTKERIKLPRLDMPAREPELRAHDFDEVNLGFDPRLAAGEALRCLECANPACVKGCPVGVKVREFVQLVYDGEFVKAAAKIREDNVLPAVTGRVCPQEDQCEGACLLGKRGAPLAIGHLERFVADYERQAGAVGLPPIAGPTGKRVAIVGSGPAGLSAAGELIQRGHQVRVLEALHEIGGVLVYGIPEFRLPKDIVRQEVDTLRRMGVEFETNVVVGKTVTLDELLGEEGYDAVFVATGAGLPRFLGIPGEHLCGVYSANEFLTRVNLMGGDRFPYSATPVSVGQRVIVIGAGNTAMDCLRVSKRLGAEVRCVYRRSEAEAPARIEELRHAKEEGIEFSFLHGPVEILLNEDGDVRGLKAQKMMLGEPDERGRRTPQPLPEFVEWPCDTVIYALGSKANPIIGQATAGLALDRRGYIVADPGSQCTNLPGVFAGGDIVTGSATVILAMAAGRRAAGSIVAWLQQGKGS